MPKILCVGIDHSVHSTGLVFLTTDGYVQLYQLTSRGVKCSPTVQHKIYPFAETNTKNYSFDDLQKIVNGGKLGKMIVTLIQQHMLTTESDSVLIHMEGSVMSRGFKSQQARVNDLVAYGTMVKAQLITNGYRLSLHIVAPGTLKKSFTGKGNCNKEKMLARFYEIIPEYDHSVGKNDDIADAYGLAEMGLKKIASNDVI